MRSAQVFPALSLVTLKSNNPLEAAQKWFLNKQKGILNAEPTNSPKLI